MAKNVVAKMVMDKSMTAKSVIASKWWLAAGAVGAGGLTWWYLRSRSDRNDFDDWDDESFAGQGDESGAERRGFADATSEGQRTGDGTGSAGSATATVEPTPAAPPEGGEVRRDIKGNIRGEDMVYHLPGDPGYDVTIEEVMFATVEEAEAAGFRPAIDKTSS